MEKFYVINNALEDSFREFQNCRALSRTMVRHADRRHNVIVALRYDRFELAQWYFGKSPLQLLKMFSYYIS